MYASCKMYSVIILTVLLCYNVAGQDINAMRNMPKYDVRYDYLDVDAILDSKRLVRNYVECLINAHRCTPEGKALKRILPEALRTKCIRCTERQKKTAVKVIKRLKYEYPEEWAKLSSRWDPTGDFTRYFEEFLAKEHFNTVPDSGNDVGVSSLPPLPSRIPIAPVQTTSQNPVESTTPPRPIILNRFGDDGELMVGSSSGTGVRPVSTTTRPTPPPATTRTPIRPAPTTRSTPQEMPTRFPLRPANDMPLPYSTAITLIDQIGYKIIRTTELVTDILRNTVRAVVGR